MAALLFSGGCRRNAGVGTSDAKPSLPDASDLKETAKKQMHDAIEAFKNRKRYPVLTREVLASISDKDLETALIDYIDDVKIAGDWEHQYEIVHRLSPGFRMVYATWQVEAEVNNGGYNQFFWNSLGEFADDAVAGFRLIGAREHAKMTQDAIAIYEKEKHTHERFKRQGTMAAFSESYKHTSLNDLDKLFYHLTEDLSKLRIAYIRAHPDQFVGKP